MPFVSTDNARFDSSTNAYQLTIAENSAVGTLIGRIAFEGESGAAGSVYFNKSGADAAKIRLEPDGSIYLASHEPLNYVAAGGPPVLDIDFSVLFIGSDGSVEQSATSGSRAMTTDVDEGPTLRVEVETDPFDEYVVDRNGVTDTTAFASLTGEDEDGDTVTYSLSGDHAGLFHIVDNEVRLKDVTTFDFETLGPSIDLTVTAESTGAGGGKQTADETITITINDVNEPIIWNQAPKTFTLDENSNASAPVGAVSARDGDGDPVTYSLSGDHADKFDIDRDAGVITVRTGAVLDYEDFAASKGVFTFQVHAIAIIRVQLTITIGIDIDRRVLYRRVKNRPAFLAETLFGFPVCWRWRFSRSRGCWTTTATSSSSTGDEDQRPERHAKGRQAGRWKVCHPWAGLQRCGLQRGSPCQHIVDEARWRARPRPVFGPYPFMIESISFSRLCGSLLTCFSGLATMWFCYVLHGIYGIGGVHVAPMRPQP